MINMKPDELGSLMFIAGSPCDILIRTKTKPTAIKGTLCIILVCGVMDQVYLSGEMIPNEH